MKKKSILITGVAGFIGSSLANSLDKNKYTIYGIDDLSNGLKSSVPKEVIFFKQDLSKKVPKKLEKNNINIDFIFHFAGQSSGEISFEDPISDLQKNTISTLNLINFSIKKKIKKFFYMSSMSVYGDANNVNEKSNLNPKTCYGVSKLSSEYYLKVFKKELNFVIFRLFNVYGPTQKLNNLKQGMIRIFMTQLINNNTIIIKGSLNRTRDFIYIDDVIKIFHSSMNIRNISNKIFNVGTGNKTTIKKIIYLLKKLHKDTSVDIISGTKGDQKNIYANIRNLKETYKIRNFTSIEDGIKIFYNRVKK